MLPARDPHCGDYVLKQVANRVVAGGSGSPFEESPDSIGHAAR